MNANKCVVGIQAIIPAILLACAPAAKAQLQIQGNVESDVTNLTWTPGTSAAVEYAPTPPGYVHTSSINTPGSGVLASAFTLKGSHGSGEATLLYKPSAGTANPTEAFGGIEAFDTLSLGSLQLSNSHLPLSGTVSFDWVVDFANLQLFNGTTPETADMTDIWILDLPLTLTLNSLTNTATLALATPYNPATMFDSSITLGSSMLQLKPADTLDSLIAALSTGTFTSSASSPNSFGTSDVFINAIMSPVPEPATYAIWAVAGIAGLVLYSRLKGRRHSVLLGA